MLKGVVFFIYSIDIDLLRYRLKIMIGVFLWNFDID